MPVFLATVLLLSFYFPLAAASPPDDLQGLIEQQKIEREEWKDADGELPAVFLRGDRAGVQIYSEANETEETIALCEPIPFDELIQLSRGDPDAALTVLNTDLPRVRDLLERTCLVRPGDEVLAVQAGQQKRISIDRLGVRSEPPVCPNDSPYSLWGLFETPLEEDPLFFSTDPAVPAGPNGYAAVPFGPAHADVRPHLRSLLPFSDEFELRQSSGMPGGILVHARRRVIRFDDKGLPNEILFSMGKTVEAIWLERVDPDYGSGSFTVRGLFDMDGNGRMDLHIVGVHQSCPYQIFLEGTETGFRPLPMPRRVCRC